MCTLNSLRAAAQHPTLYAPTTNHNSHQPYAAQEGLVYTVYIVAHVSLLYGIP